MSNNGGPAFPREDYQGDSAPGQTGMSLRDYFAAAAMQGMYAEDAERHTFEGVAKAAYLTADAMLAERSKS